MIEPRIGISRGRVDHIFSHRKLELEILDAHFSGGEPPAHPRALSFYQATRWVYPEELSSMPISSLARKVLVCLEVLDGSP